jgi:integrase
VPRARKPAPAANQEKLPGNIYDAPGRPPGHKIIKVPDGHGKFITRRANSPQKAKQIYDQIIAELEDGLKPKGASMTLQAFMSEWWERVIKPRSTTSNALAPNTLKDYRSTIEKYLLPDWGNYKLRDITADVVIDIFYAVAARHSESMAHRVVRKLHMLLAAARRRRYVRYNAVEDAREELPSEKPAKGKKPHMDIEQTRRLFATVEQHRLALAYHILLTLGLRIGELLGLQWEDIDWEDRTIRVGRQVQEVGGKKHIRNEAKTDAGNRVLPIPQRLYARLYAAWERRGDTVFIITNDEGGALAPSNFAHHFRGGRAGRKNKNGQDKVVIGMRQKAQLPPTISAHIFRHTVGMRLVDLNIRPEISDAIMGHGAKGVRGLYGHATMEAMRKALEQLEEELFSGT